MARVHPSIHDENLKEKTKKFLWSEPKFQLLAETIIELKSKKVKDTDLASSKIFGRSSQATQKIWTKPEYKLIENLVRNELNVEQNLQIMSSKLNYLVLTLTASSCLHNNLHYDQFVSSNLHHSVATILLPLHLTLPVTSSKLCYNFQIRQVFVNSS